jgi:hypothetical protein
MSQTETIILNRAPALEVIWGAKEIAAVLGRTEKAVFHALERNRIPGAKKIGGKWALDLRVFRAAFEAAA